MLARSLVSNHSKEFYRDDCLAHTKHTRIVSHRKGLHIVGVRVAVAAVVSVGVRVAVAAVVSCYCCCS